MSKRKPKYDEMHGDKRVRIYATRVEYEVLVGDGDIDDPDASVWCFPKVGLPSDWARQALLNEGSK